MSKPANPFLALDYSSGDDDTDAPRANAAAAPGRDAKNKSEKKKAANDLRAEVFGRRAPKKGPAKSTAAVPSDGLDSGANPDDALAAAKRLEESRLETYQAELAVALAASLADDGAAATKGGAKKKPAKSHGKGGAPLAPPPHSIERIVREEVARERFVAEIEEERLARRADLPALAAASSLVGAAATSAPGGGGNGGAVLRAPPGLTRPAAASVSAPRTTGAPLATASAPSRGLPVSCSSADAMQSPLRLLSISEAASIGDPAQLLQHYALATSEVARLEDENASLALRVAELTAALRLAGLAAGGLS